MFRYVYVIIAVLLALTGQPCCEKKSYVEIPPPEYDPSAPPPGPEDPPGPEAPEEVTYTLMSYNVGAFKKYKETLEHYSFPEVAAVIRYAGPQVVGLNETDWEGKRTDYLHQATELATVLGSDWDARFWYAGYTWYGNSMVWDGSRLTAQKEFPRLRFPKGESGSEERSMGAVEFGDFTFCVTHLDHKSEEDRLYAVNLLTAWVKEQYGASGKPVFLVGDLNAVPASSTLSSLRENWTQLSGNAYTYPTSNLTKCIDFILVFNNGAEKKIQVLDAGVVTPQLIDAAGTASDHCPVWVKVRWQKE
ncbi:MAG: endonuclease/exonuclease/phosphatase family protein [Bacteroidales bacterium]|nr:endonuclease/exonuclease/phosphatase family protein [Bacteroidales bacterium]